MSPPRTPTNILELTGRLKHDRKRYELQGRGEIPGADLPLGPPPEERILSFAEAWAAIVDMCPEGVLRQRDRGVVAETARLHMQLNNLRVMEGMEGSLGLRMMDDQVLKISRLYQSYLARLGASPIDANKVPVGKPKSPSSDFD